MRAALVLAAGQSRRFGAADKLLTPVEGGPMLAHALEAARAAAGLRLATVSSEPVAALVRAHGFQPVPVPAGAPQSASLRAGLAAARQHGATQLLVLLGDMPFVQATDVAALLALAGTEAACATGGTTPLPPAAFPEEMFAALAGTQGDRGAGALLREIPAARRLTLPPDRLRDIDRPEDLRAGP